MFAIMLGGRSSQPSLPPRPSRTHKENAWCAITATLEEFLGNRLATSMISLRAPARRNDGGAKRSPPSRHDVHHHRTGSGDGLLDDRLHVGRALSAEPVAPQASASLTKSGWTSRSPGSTAAVESSCHCGPSQVAVVDDEDLHGQLILHTGDQILQGHLESCRPRRCRSPIDRGRLPGPPWPPGARSPWSPARPR